MVIRDIREMQDTATAFRDAGKRIAVVPTMGYLHEGHSALIREAKNRADVVVTTVFVNPTQFGPGEDFERYPRDLDHDVRIAKDAGTSIVFAPATDAMYQSHFSSFVLVEEITSVLEGKSRPGHFRGVATVVAKLFHITQPHVAVFGQKDAQQVIVIRRMIRDLNFAVDLVVVPTVREKDGLALSSRNTYLTPQQRHEAPVLHMALCEAQKNIASGCVSCMKLVEAMKEMITKQSSGVIDYVSVADAETLEELTVLNGHMEILVSLAVRFGQTRLIDNILTERKEHRS